LDGRRGGIDGDEGEDAFGATCKHDRQRDFAAAGGVEDGVGEDAGVDAADLHHAGLHPHVQVVGLGRGVVAVGACRTPEPR